MTQALLSFSAAPVSAEQDAAKLQALLRRLGGWQRRRTLENQIGFQRWSERRFRAAAAASKGQILGGNGGYCLAELATLEEARQARNRLAGQIEDMKQRLLEIDRVFHGRI
jgi:hypothetical protein